MNKVLILQRVIPCYRVALFRLLSESDKYSIKFIIGESSSKLKAKNCNDLIGVNHIKLKTYVLNVLGRPFVFHHNLLRIIRDEKPGVIICEAESHFLGYLTAIFYKRFFDNNVSLVKWCFFALPGVDRERSIIHGWLKQITKKYFLGFLSYTTYGLNHLAANGVEKNSVVVAVNVCDTNKFLSLDNSLNISKEKAKDLIGHGSKFIISYFGTIQKEKNPDYVVELAQRLQYSNIAFLIIGTGPYQNHLHDEIKKRKLTNCFMTGRIDEGIAQYYRASDLVIIPGRGGIVISEAMCFGVPVVLFQADGVECDLIRHGETGYFAKYGSVEAFEEVIINLYNRPDQLNYVGLNAKRQILDKFNTEAMRDSIFKVIEQVTRE